jgi:hypothetical protein
MVKVTTVEVVMTWPPETPVRVGGVRVTSSTPKIFRNHLEAPKGVFRRI